jgi:hypothetical protein
VLDHVEAREEIDRAVGERELLDVLDVPHELVDPADVDAFEVPDVRREQRPHPRLRREQEPLPAARAQAIDLACDALPEQLRESAVARVAPAARAERVVVHVRGAAVRHEARAAPSAHVAGDARLLRGGLRRDPRPRVPQHFLAHEDPPRRDPAVAGDLPAAPQLAQPLPRAHRRNLRHSAASLITAGPDFASGSIRFQA